MLFRSPQVTASAGRAPIPPRSALPVGAAGSLLSFSGAGDEEDSGGTGCSLSSGRMGLAAPDDEDSLPEEEADELEEPEDELEGEPVRALQPQREKIRQAHSRRAAPARRWDRMCMK